MFATDEAKLDARIDFSLCSKLFNRSVPCERGAKASHGELFGESNDPWTAMNCGKTPAVQRDAAS